MLKIVFCVTIILSHWTLKKYLGGIIMVAEKTKTSFDLTEVISWLENHKTKIRLPRDENTFPFFLKKGNLPQLSIEIMSGIINLFPKNTIERSMVNSVIGLNPLWFRNNSKPEKLTFTSIEKEQRSEKSIISAVYFDPNIFICNIHKDVCSEIVRDILQAWGFTHALAHSIISPAFHTSNYKLRMIDGVKVDGKHLINLFFNLTSSYPPISWYAGRFQEKSGKFIGDKEKSGMEVFAETITAHILGFSYKREISRTGHDYTERLSFDPFSDREVIKDFVENFLLAKRIS